MCCRVKPDESADRLLLSKGHGSSGLYGTLAAVGVLSPEDVLQGYCSDGGLLAGHPERGVPGVEMTGGSLGHGPAIAVGIALAERHIGRRRTYCLVGDGELDEGSVWEAFALAGQLGLDRLTVIVDANGLQGLGPCADVLGRHPLKPKLEAFGLAVQEVDGHDHEALRSALDGSGRRAAEGRDRPDDQGLRLGRDGGGRDVPLPVAARARPRGGARRTGGTLTCATHSSLR